MVRDVDGWYYGRWHLGERRRKERATIGSVTAQCQSNQGVAICEVEDVSTGGVRMVAGLPEGAHVDIELYLPNDRTICTSARVVHHRYPRQSVGLAFEHLDEVDRRLISRMVDEAEEVH